MLTLPMLAVYVHHLNPFALRLWGEFGIRWYGLSYLVGFVIGYLLIKRVTKVGVSTLKPGQVSDFVVTVAIGVLVGGRLGYVAFYEPSLLWDPPVLGVFMVWRGGMASHGGMIGGILATWYFARRGAGRPHSWPFLLDLFAFAAPLGLFFGRIANFINGELIGRPCDPALAWAVKFPQEMYYWSAERMSQSQLPVLIAIFVPERVSRHGPEASVEYLIGQMQAGNEKVIQAIGPLLTPRHPSQLYEALLEGLVLFLVLAVVWAKPRKPLVIGGTFGLAYGLLRIVGEFFRMPDAQIANQEFAHWGITRGQWLSALLSLTGAILLVLFSRRKVAAQGGWMRGKAAPGVFTRG